MKAVTVINRSGKEIDYNAAVDFMEYELIKYLHYEIAPCSEQEFFTAYEKAHEEKFGHEWFLSDSNPVW